jgi:hypothetical protein
MTPSAATTTSAPIAGSAADDDESVDFATGLGAGVVGSECRVGAVVADRVVCTWFGERVAVGLGECAATDVCRRGGGGGAMLAFEPVRVETGTCVGASGVADCGGALCVGRALDGAVDAVVDDGVGFGVGCGSRCPQSAA